MRGYVIRFSINGVYNQSDPFRREATADVYGQSIDARGGVDYTSLAPTEVKREAQYIDKQVEERYS